MSAFCKLCSAFFFVMVVAFGKRVLAGNPTDYLQRQTDYINTGLANLNRDGMVLQAYQGVPLDSATLYSTLASLPTNDVVDFDIVKLVRILYFTNGQYDSIILPELNKLPFWLRKDEDLRVYWSENHMILWMSSDWLLHERYGRAIDSTLDLRLRHYLRMKIQYGYYEFFSSTYLPFSLTALLNLADFAQDAEIKNLAEQAAQRLLKDILMLTNDAGVYFPAAGRNYYEKYQRPYNQNHSHLIHLLTGMGPAPGNGSHAGVFLATSTLAVDSVIPTWTPVLDTLYTIGHSLDSGFVLNAHQAPMDKVIFQWSSGAYFHPDVALETALLLRDSTLWDHHEFADFTRYSHLDVNFAPTLAQLASPISKSSCINGQNVAIFKHNSVTLSSIQDFWKGKLGYQQFPCVANVGGTAVLTASGSPYRNWNNGSTSNANEHLPSVHQKSNVALLMYRPEKVGLNFFEHDSLAVVLHLDESDFEFVEQDQVWVIGKRGQNYVAVRRACTDEVNGRVACDLPLGQSWVFVVGDSGMYGSYNNFKSIVHQAQFEERWYVDSSAQKSVYYAKVVIDTITVDYAWAVDTVLATSRKELETVKGFGMFPNPADDAVSLALSAFENQPLTIKVMNQLGIVVFNENIASLKNTAYTIPTVGWAQGIYFVAVESKQQSFIQKLVKR